MSRYQRPVLPPIDGLRDATSKLREENDRRAAKLAAGAEVTVRTPRLDPDQESARAELQRAGEFMGDEIAKLRTEDGSMPGVPSDVRNLIDSAEILIGGMVEFCKTIGARTSGGRRDAIAAMREAIDSLKRYQGDFR